MIAGLGRKAAPARLAAEHAPNVTLRLMEDRDLDAVMVIEKRCFSLHWTREAIACEMGNGSAFYVVVEIDDRVVGYAGQWVIMDEAHITTLGVSPEYQGLRIGERLLIALLQEGRYRGARRATLEVRMSNEPAVTLYRKYGFDTVAIRKRYYQDTDEDALIMWVNDLHAPSVSFLLNQTFGPGE